MRKGVHITSDTNLIYMMLQTKVNIQDIVYSLTAEKKIRQKNVLKIF